MSRCRWHSTWGQMVRGRTVGHYCLSGNSMVGPETMLDCFFPSMGVNDTLVLPRARAFTTRRGICGQVWSCSTPVALWVSAASRGSAPVFGPDGPVSTRACTHESRNTRRIRSSTDPPRRNSRDLKPRIIIRGCLMNSPRCLVLSPHPLIVKRGRRKGYVITRTLYSAPRRN